MAADINRVVLVGRLTRDAEQSYTQSGYAILKFSIAVNRSRKQGDQWVEEANFFDITLWGRQGEAIASYMTKGKQVAVEGQLRQDRWEDKNDGSKRSKVFVEASSVQLLGGRDSGSQGGNRQSGGNWNNNSFQTPPPNQQRPQQAPPSSNFEDDIPF